MKQNIKAIAFDIDGTLYPNYRLYIRLLPFLIFNIKFMYNFGKVRKKIRLWQEDNPGKKKEDFFLWQAQLFSQISSIPVEKSKELIKSKIYEGWLPIFRKVKPFKNAKEVILELKKSGYKIALLSDFLPSQKEDVWGIAPLCDVVLGSEETGALKPSKIPFDNLSKNLGLENSEVLYVGNSISADVVGASNAGMKTALIRSNTANLLNKKIPGLDISFNSYRKFLSLMIK